MTFLIKKNSTPLINDFEVNQIFIHNQNKVFKINQ